ncbi:hypothetical protein BSLG_008138 [Batrachochytrium salamandrivorans]|nr:hypothetical protein BASA60_008884 [Batrachochytrium salamandrivorans]KAH9245098.1 hypothetical protein BASA81_017434 [Batrachochytrium salamandrivorans]KAH9270512.1 hypothetical protein BASA83_007324 [Batrachochytrium salamandrivorans]KAJ1334303.1 hypothetical protein BSLG_008138 [Batrachochytrium salamandrivorans]
MKDTTSTSDAIHRNPRIPQADPVGLVEPQSEIALPSSVTMPVGMVQPSLLTTQDEKTSSSRLVLGDHKRQVPRREAHLSLPSESIRHAASHIGISSHAIATAITTDALADGTLALHTASSPFTAHPRDPYPPLPHPIHHLHPQKPLMATQSSTSIQAYANRFRKPPAVVLSGSHICPNPRPSQPPPPPPPLPLPTAAAAAAAVVQLQHDNRTVDSGDEPASISELIRGSPTVTRDPYDACFDDITGWDDYVGENLVSILLSTSNSATYKYLTPDPTFNRTADERPSSIAAIKRRPFRRQTETKPLKTRTTISPQDVGEESNDPNTNPRHLGRDLGGEEESEMNSAIPSVPISSFNRAKVQSSQRCSSSICKTAPSDPPVLITPPLNMASRLQHRSGNHFKSRPSTSIPCSNSESAIRYSQNKREDLQQCKDSENDRSESSQQFHSTTADTIGHTGLRRSIYTTTCSTSQSVHFTGDSNPRSRPVTSERNSLDTLHQGSLSLHPVDQPALIKKDSVPSSTSTKTHWKSSQVSTIGFKNSCGSATSLDLTDLTVVTGRKYYKSDSSDQSNHNVAESGTNCHQRPQTAAAILSRTNTDGPILPRIFPSCSVSSLSGEMALAPIIKRLGTHSKPRPQTSLNSRNQRNACMIDNGHGSSLGSRLCQRLVYPLDVTAANPTCKYYVKSEKHLFIPPSASTATWVSTESPVQHRSASLDRFRLATANSHPRHRAPKRLSKDGFQPVLIPTDPTLAYLNGASRKHVEQTRDHGLSVPVETIHLHKRPSTSTSTSTSAPLALQRNSNNGPDHEHTPNTPVEPKEYRSSGQYDMKPLVQKELGADSRTKKNSRSFRNQVHLNRVSGGIKM